jgi:hypothetical protein
MKTSEPLSIFFKVTEPELVAEQYKKPRIKVLLNLNMKFIQILVLAFSISALPMARMSKKYVVIGEGNAAIEADVVDGTNVIPVGDAVGDSIVGVPLAAPEDENAEELLNESEFL